MHTMVVQRAILSTRRIMLPPLTLCAYMKKGPNLRWNLIQCSGGDEGDRTPDLLTASQALSQLSYAPVQRSTIRELGRRCKDNFGKTFRGASADAGRAQERGARDARSGPRGVARGRRPRRRPPSRPLSAAAADRPPRNRPIYYVWAASPDHARLGENKTAGRRPAVFAKYGVWSMGQGKT